MPTCNRVTVRGLCGATMHNGSRYDGRFNLKKDINQAKVENVNTDDPKAMANFYSVHPEEYLAGQELGA